MKDNEKCKWQDTCGYDICIPEYCSDFEATRITNADRIRAMSDGELARLLFKFCCNSETCNFCHLHDGSCAEDENLPEWMKWVKQPVEE